MQDHPSPAAILDLSIVHLRENVLPQLSGRAQFDMRVTLGALQLVRRQLMLSPESDAAELERLRALLGEEGDLAALNAALCEKIKSGALGAQSPGLMAHLCATALEKLAVDQPNYPAYRRAAQV